MTRKTFEHSAETVEPEKGDGGFSDRLRTALGRKSGSWLAKQIGASASTVNDWLRGGSEPGLSKLVACATELGVFIEWLSTGRGPMCPADEIDNILNDIEARLADKEVPISPDRLNQEPRLLEDRHRLSEIAENAGLADPQRARADNILALAFSEKSAKSRKDQRLGDVASRLREAADAFAEAVQRVGWEPPLHISIAVRDAMFVHGLTVEGAIEILDAVRREISSK